MGTFPNKYKERAYQKYKRDLEHNCLNYFDFGNYAAILDEGALSLRQEFEERYANEPDTIDKIKVELRGGYDGLYQEGHLYLKIDGIEHLLDRAYKAGIRDGKQMQEIQISKC